MYRAETEGIEVVVEPFYLEDRSDPTESHYVWAYRVTIANKSDLPARLVSRYWNITDGNGHVEEVAGDGVVGEQPELRPGDSYQYTSGCPLATPSGIMVGHYTMTDANGRRFNVDIPAFSLDTPDHMRTIN
ncbi:MAG: Co2+/Mg2+ efflux protein ApaG [Rhizobiaceae bacterium]